MYWNVFSPSVCVESGYVVSKREMVLVFPGSKSYVSELGRCCPVVETAKAREVRCQKTDYKGTKCSMKKHEINMSMMFAYIKLYQISIYLYRNTRDYCFIYIALSQRMRVGQYY